MTDRTKTIYDPDLRSRGYKKIRLRQNITSKMINAMPSYLVGNVSHKPAFSLTHIIVIDVVNTVSRIIGLTISKNKTSKLIFTLF